MAGSMKWLTYVVHVVPIVLDASCLNVAKLIPMDAREEKEATSQIYLKDLGVLLSV